MIGAELWAIEAGIDGCRGILRASTRAAATARAAGTAGTSQRGAAGTARAARL